MVSESEYCDYLEVVFGDRFGPDNVNREVTTPSGRRADFYIETELLDFAVEVENESDTVVTNGVVQALLYGQELDAVPVVVYPASDNENRLEIAQLSAYCEIIQIPYKF